MRSVARQAFAGVAFAPSPCHPGRRWRRGTSRSESRDLVVRMLRRSCFGASKVKMSFANDTYRSITMLERIAEGRTDLIFEYVAQGNPASAKTADGTSLLHWCAYYGDVSAIRFLLAHGESLQSLGDDLGLNAAAFHGHWRLCQFVLESGAKANFRDPDTGESALHAALSSHRSAQHWVVTVLLEA